MDLSVTAFPVLARILTDRAIHKTRMGANALTCAAIGDVTAQCMLAFVVAIIEWIRRPVLVRQSRPCRRGGATILPTTSFNRR
jgi:Kef-type K+ transport system membrane component KefB